MEIVDILLNVSLMSKKLSANWFIIVKHLIILFYYSDYRTVQLSCPGFISLLQKCHKTFPFQRLWAFLIVSHEGGNEWWGWQMGVVTHPPSNPPTSRRWRRGVGVWMHAFSGFAKIKSKPYSTHTHSGGTGFASYSSWLKLWTIHSTANNTREGGGEKGVRRETWK